MRLSQFPVVCLAGALIAGQATLADSGPAKSAVATKTGVQLSFMEASDGKITFRATDLPERDVIPVAGADKDGWGVYQGPDTLRKALGSNRFDHIVEARVASNRTAQQLVAMPHLEKVFFGCSMRVTDAAIDYLIGLRELRSLHFGANNITDAGLAKLSALPRLERLEMRYTKVTDGGLAHLKTFPHLRALLLPGAITDAGLTHLNGWAQLEELSLRGTHVADAGLENLKGLTNLRLLDLAYTTVSGPGLAHLKGLTQLRTLDLHGTQVTDKAAMKLQQALPNCRIQR